MLKCAICTKEVPQLAFAMTPNSVAEAIAGGVCEDCCALALYEFLSLDQSSAAAVIRENLLTMPKEIRTICLIGGK